MVLACAALAITIALLGGVDWRSFVAILPIGAISFLLALTISLFVTQPLGDLITKIQNYRMGDQTVDFAPNGRLGEADELASNFSDLIETANAQTADLARREKQQMQFVSDVAHELRTPLTAIHGNAELLLDDELPDNMRQKFTETIVTESERLSRLANDLLSLQKIEQAGDVSSMSRVNLRIVAQEAVDALTSVLAERGANIEIVGEAPDVLGNEDRLVQVVSNLVDNASRFVDPGGHIVVELYGVGGNSVVAVKDDGPGFGDIDPQMLFERFFRTDFSRARNTGGSGLGLSIVKSIVEAHDGTVNAYNQPEGGACFTVAIPSLPFV